MSEKFEFIDGMKYAYPVTRMCAWLSVSRSGFYEWRARPSSATTERHEDLKAAIREIFEASDQTYDGEHMRTSLVIDAIDMATHTIDLPAGTIFHSDRGCPVFISRVPITPAQPPHHSIDRTHRRLLGQHAGRILQRHPEGSIETPEND